LKGMLMYALGNVQQRLGRHQSNLETLTARAGRGATDVGRWRQRLYDLEVRTLRAVQAGERDRRAHLRRCQAQLQALDPQATLDRGYAVVHRDGRLVSSIAAVSTGDGLVIKVADGGFPARVNASGSRRQRSSAAKAPRRNGARQPQGVQPVLFP